MKGHHQCCQVLSHCCLVVSCGCLLHVQQHLAGRAAEHGWGISKLDYRKINCGDSSKTRECIEKSFEGLAVEVVRRLGRKVRECKIAYRAHIEEQEEE